MVARMGRARHVVLLTASADESDMYRWWLESSGYCVSVVLDVPTACDVATSGCLDVLVIDAVFVHADASIRLPELLRALAHRRGFGLITLSGYLTDAWPRQRADGHICLLKPCPPLELSQQIEQLLSESGSPPPRP